MGYDFSKDTYELSASAGRKFVISNLDEISGSGTVLDLYKQLDIIGDVSTLQLKELDGGTTYTSQLQNNGNKLLISTLNNGDIELKTNQFDNAVYIDSSADRVGIGTNSPLATLHVAGNLQVDGYVTASVVTASTV